MRPDLGLLSWPVATPQPRHSAMQEVTPPVAHRADMHPENRGDVLGPPPLQRQQDRPRPIRFAALLRFRQVTQHGPFRGIRRELRFPWHAWPPQPSSQANNPFRRPFAGALLSTEAGQGPASIRAEPGGFLKYSARCPMFRGRIRLGAVRERDRWEMRP